MKDIKVPGLINTFLYFLFLHPNAAQPTMELHRSGLLCHLSLPVGGRMSFYGDRPFKLSSLSLDILYNK
ncbi:hypothetical protein AMELA_G00174400, partial [Ameiurus melas]